MRRRRPDQTPANPTPPPAPNHTNESIQTDDEDSKHIVRKAVSQKARTRQAEIEQQWMTVQRTIIAKRRFIFPLGLLLGVLLTYFFFPPIPPHLSMLLEEYDISLPMMKNLTFAFEWRQLAEPLLEGARTWTQTRDFSVGTEAAEKGLKAKYPVILIPGIVSTGLESWSTSPEYRQYFRKRLWGTTTMVRAVLTERDKWMAALMLDPETGLDPPGVKVRAAQGLDAASTFIPGYWIWAKVIENLACINYDTNNLELAAYDWRLSYYNLEVRDGYFSRLKNTVEAFKKREGRKVVLVGMKWVEAEGYGNGGPTWVEDHIESFVNIAGPMLGVPKAMTAFLSGEMKDTVEVNPAGSYVLEKFFSRKDRAKLFRSWAGGASMWVKGGDAVWGNATHAPDDMDDTAHTHGHFFSFRALTPDSEPSSLPAGHSATTTASRPKHHPTMAPVDEEAAERATAKQKNGQDVEVPPRVNPPAPPPVPAVETSPGVGNLTADEAGNWILQHTPYSWQKMIATNYSYGIERDEKVLKRNGQDHTKWTNPLEIQLPNAPSMKIFCLYGHGKETERSYWYARGEYEYDDMLADAVQAVCYNTTECDTRGVTPKSPLDMPTSRQNWIDALVTRENEVPKVRNGVKIGEGDGTVASLSLGAMCVEGWNRKRWNPAGIKTVTYEMAHKPEAMDIRGGATTADHIDILGASVLNEIVLKVAAGDSDDIEDHFVSALSAISLASDSDEHLLDSPLLHRPQNDSKSPWAAFSGKTVYSLVAVAFVFSQILFAIHSQISVRTLAASGNRWHASPDEEVSAAMDALVATHTDGLLNDVRTLWSDSEVFPQTKLIRHAPGFTVLDNLYSLNGTIYIVSDRPTLFPETKMMTSSGVKVDDSQDRMKKLEPSNKDIRIIGVKEAKVLFGKQAGSVSGVSFMNSDDPQYITHYYHFSAELLFGLWRTYTSPDADIHSNGATILPSPSRLIFTHTG
ncbi:hypothetical protein FRB90_003616, partial [Tulasnella sp. 427]